MVVSASSLSSPHAAATQATELTIAHVSPGLVMASRGPVCVALWRGKPTRALFEIQRAELAAGVTKLPGTQLFLCIIEAKADPPDEPVRRASAQMLNEHGSRLAAFACVIEGSGFRSALTRTVLTGISLLVPKPSPHRFFDATPTACAWLARLAPSSQLAGLAEQIAAARAQLSQ